MPRSNSQPPLKLNVSGLTPMTAAGPAPPGSKAPVSPGPTPHHSRQSSTSRSRRDFHSPNSAPGTPVLGTKPQSRSRHSPRSPRAPEAPGSEDGSYFSLHRPPSSGVSSPKLLDVPREHVPSHLIGQDHPMSIAASATRKFDSTFATSPSNLDGGALNNGRPNSPVRALSNSYAPRRVPSSQHLSSSPSSGSWRKSSGGNHSTQGSAANGASTSKGLSSSEHPAGAPSSQSFRKSDPHAMYLAQEKQYLQKLRHDLIDDYYSTGLSPSGEQPVTNDNYADGDDDDDSVSDFGSAVSGFGGLGTSFDDEYTGLSSAPQLDASSYTNLIKHMGGANDRIPDDETLRERLEWQSMLMSVLTGEVFRSEKRRMWPVQGERENGIDEEELWLGVRATAAGRTVEEQKKVLSYARSTVNDTLDQVMAFHVDSGNVAEEDVRNQVTQLVQNLYRCENLYRSRIAMRAENSRYASAEFQYRAEALITWKNVSNAIAQEVELLRNWTGNDECDPTKPAKRKRGDVTITTSPVNVTNPGPIEDESLTLAERVLKRENLTDIFENRIARQLGPIIEKARDATIEYSELFLQLGLPLFHKGVLHLLSFPVVLVREIIRLRLSYARRMVNPTMMIVDQMIGDYSTYIRHALDLMQRNLQYTAPVLDKGWIFPSQVDEGFNATLLDCVSFYIELLNRHYLDGGRSSKALLRAFKDTDLLESHYAFLLEVGGIVQGIDVTVAEQISLLVTRISNRLIGYWEHQIKGPANMTSHEIERWMNLTMEVMRSYQRKLHRYYRVLAENYENATEYSMDPHRVKPFLNALRESGHFLAYTGTFEKYGIYAIADPSLKDKPDVFQAILAGYSRLDQDRDEPEIVEDRVSYVLIFCIEEPLVWEGDIVNIETNYFDVDLKPGRMRLVTEGGWQELKWCRKHVALITRVGGLDQESSFFDIAVDRKSHMVRVDKVLGRMRRLLFKLSTSIIMGAMSYRKKCRQHPGTQDTIQNLFVFTRETGQRGLALMDALRRGVTAIRLINLCVEWLSFVCDDCVPTDSRTFRWAVYAMEFAMVMTRGVNIVAISPEQFGRLRVKVAECMTLMISHFDIIGARSKALQKSNEQHKFGLEYTAVKDDDELIRMLRQDTIRKLPGLEHQEDAHIVGRVVDEDAGTNDEALTQIAEQFTKVSIRWQQGRFIGGGSFGSVYAAVNLDTGGVMAVKEIRLQDSNSVKHILKSIKDEMTVLEMLRHPNIVQYYGVEVHRDRVYIFMEYCQGGSLAGLMAHGRIEDEQIIQVYTLQMLEGVAYLHQSGIVHRDIKPENILLDHNGVVKFVDFGAAKVIAKTGKTYMSGFGTLQPVNGPKTKLNSMTGTPMYMSPEVITGSNSGKRGSIDIWSLGCCVLEMATGRRPWANLDNEWAIMYHIAAGHLPQLPSNDQMSAEGIRFLMRMLERDPNERPTAVDLLVDPWIVAIRNIVIGCVSTGDEGSVATSPSEQPLGP